MKTLLPIFLAAGLLISCHDSPKPSSSVSVPVVWLVPGDTTFTSFSDLFDNYSSLARELVQSSYYGQPIDRIEYEIRDPARHLRLARIPSSERLLPRDANQKDDNFYHPYYSKEDRQRRLTGIGPGDYRIALLINGVRASNVVQVRIDPAYDYKSQPPVRLAKIEAPPTCAHGALVARVVAPPANAGRISYSDIVGGSLICDGDHFASPYFAFHANPTFQPGERVAFRLEVDRYLLNRDDLNQTRLPVSEEHTYGLQVHTYPLASIACDLATTPLCDAWDRETATIPDAPPAPHVLTGFVRDGQGHPLAHAEVLIYQEHASYLELVDANGHYAFDHLSPGAYSTGAYRLDIPRQSTSPYFPPIVITPDQPNTRDFVFPTNSMN